MEISHTLSPAGRFKYTIELIMHEIKQITDKSVYVH